MSQRLDLEHKRDKALLQALRAECAIRREQAIEELRDARLVGDLVRYQQLLAMWQQFPHVFGKEPPPV
jgi:hypothetical protein